MDVNLYDLNRLGNVEFDVVCYDDGSNGVALYSKSGDLLAFFPQGNLSVELFHLLSYVAINNINLTLSGFGFKPLQKEISLLTKSKEYSKRRGFSYKVLDCFSS